MFVFLFFHLSCMDAYTFQPDISASIIRNNGISVTIIPYNVNTTNTKWIVNPISSIGYDISLQITSQLGFNAAAQSTLSIKMDGFTPNHAKIGGTILILFSTNNNKYFSVIINLENDIPWKIYPDDQGAELAINSDILNNIIQGDDTRWNRISNTNQWKDIGGKTPYKHDLRWPLNINIINDPIHNKVYYECIQPKNTLILATFDSAFDVNKGMDIYIMNNEVGTNKPFDVFSFEIIYSSSFPTFIPTISPTLSPSIFSTTFDQITFMPTSMPTESSMSTATSTTQAAAVTVNNDILIYLVIVGVAMTCFVTGIIIGIVFYRKKMNKNGSHITVPSATLHNDESEFNEINGNNEFELTQLQNELQYGTDRIILGKDKEKYRQDDKKLTVEDDVTNVVVERNIEGKEHINNGQYHDTLFVDR